MRLTRTPSERKCVLFQYFMASLTLFLSSHPAESFCASPPRSASRVACPADDSIRPIRSNGRSSLRMHADTISYFLNDLNSRNSEKEEYANGGTGKSEAMGPGLQSSGGHLPSGGPSVVDTVSYFLNDLKLRNNEKINGGERSVRKSEVVRDAPKNADAVSYFLNDLKLRTNGKRNGGERSIRNSEAVRDAPNNNAVRDAPKNTDTVSYFLNNLASQKKKRWRGRPQRRSGGRCPPVRRPVQPQNSRQPRGVRRRRRARHRRIQAGGGPVLRHVVQELQGDAAALPSADARALRYPLPGGARDAREVVRDQRTGREDVSLRTRVWSGRRSGREEEYREEEFF